MAAMTGTFKIGEKVVYPAHGVGVIEGVQTKVISGNERKFYMLRIIDSDMTIMIPTENVQSVGLRRIIGKDIARLDVPAKTNGSTVYGIDVQVPGMVYATMLRSPVAFSTAPEPMKLPSPIMRSMLGWKS